MVKSSSKTVRITQINSAVKRPKDQIDTIKGLGIRRLHQTVEVIDTPSVRGMINKVSHLLRVEE